MVFELNGSEYCFKGTVTLVPGDNLASQYLGGYKSLARALRRCRQCMAVDKDMKSKVIFCLLSEVHVFTYSFQFVSQDFTPRTRLTHRAHCQSLNGPLYQQRTAYGEIRF